MSDQPDLTSWKEIAAYLKVSVRTAQAWEKDRGLPVNRLPGGRGRVMARTQDLDKWSRNTPPKEIEATVSEPISTARSSRHLRYGGALAITFLVVVLATFMFRPRPHPAQWKVVNDMLIVSDIAGNEVFRKTFPPVVQSHYTNRTAAEATMAWIGDIDDDHVPETLFLEDKLDKSTILRCYSANGDERWQYTVGRRITMGNVEFDNVFLTNNFRVTRLRDHLPKVIIIASYHAINEPAQIVLLSTDGEVLREYWHAGHIGHSPVKLQVLDLDHDGRSELYLTGISQARNQATLVVLDPDTMQGAASEDDPKYRFHNQPAGTELARLFFPRTALNLKFLPYNVGQRIHLGNDSLVISVLESFMHAEAPMVLYQLRPDLSLDNVSFSDSFTALQRRLYEERQITSLQTPDDPTMRKISKFQN